MKSSGYFLGKYIMTSFTECLEYPSHFYPSSRQNPIYMLRTSSMSLLQHSCTVSTPPLPCLHSTFCTSHILENCTLSSKYVDVFFPPLVKRFFPRQAPHLFMSLFLASTKINISHYSTVTKILLLESDYFSLNPIPAVC